MKTRFLIIFISLIFTIALAACGPSAEQLNSTATQVAFNIFATQTAQAPTATMTFTPSPTATSTPTPTSTPTETSTPPPTPTPTPGYESVALTLNDLPFGFESMPQSQVNDMEKALPKGAVGFGFIDNSNFQMIIGIIYPLDPDPGLAVVDTMLPEFVKLYATMFGADKDIKDLAGAENLGVARAAITSTGPMGGFTLRWENMAFYRDHVIVILINGYQESYQPDVSAIDLGQLLDERLMLYHYPMGFASPANADAISGTWQGTIIGENDTTVSELTMEIKTGCTVSSTCGTFTEPTTSCSGDIVLESITGNTYVFSEQNASGTTDCRTDAREYIRLLSNGKLFWRYEFTDPFGGDIIAKALLEKK